MLTTNTIKQKILPRLGYSGKYGAWRIIYILIIGVLFSAALFTIYFIYQNINIALSNTAIILNLESNVQFEIIDISAYKNAASIIEKKKNTSNLPKNLRNIFEYSIGTVSVNDNCDANNTSTTTTIIIGAGATGTTGAAITAGVSDNSTSRRQTINKC